MWLSHAGQRCEHLAFDDAAAPGDEFDWGDLLRLAAFERDEGRMVRHVRKVMCAFSPMDRRRLPVG